MQTTSTNQAITQETTFHEGEQAMQIMAGVSDRLAELGPRVIRDQMPDQHRAFFRQLPFVIVAVVDKAGQPWASILVNQSGFLISPSADQLDVLALPTINSPLYGMLHEGAAIALLGIEPHTRRRNRLNGVVNHINAYGFSVHVQQSFGNCPKYIQARQASYVPMHASQSLPVKSDVLDEAAINLLQSADTFFIASAYPNTSDLIARHGADVSHRGGLAGFIDVLDQQTLMVPDYQGNYFFNTLGNLLVNPKAGLLVIDYQSGDLLHLAAEVEMVFDQTIIRQYPRAERLLKLHVKQMIRVYGPISLAWGAAEVSPWLGRS